MPRVRHWSTPPSSGQRILTRAIGIAVDGSGNAYVTGIAFSPDFPTTAGAFQTTFGTAPTDAFVTELNAAGTALVYSTFLGGSGGAVLSEHTSPGGIAVDSSGNIYVTGITGSTNFPTKNALQATYGGGQYDAFVAEINPSQVGAASLVYSTYLGGSDQDEAMALPWTARAMLTSRGSRIHWTSQPRTPINRNGLHRRPSTPRSAMLS